MNKDKYDLHEWRLCILAWISVMVLLLLAAKLALKLWNDFLLWTESNDYTGVKYIYSCHLKVNISWISSWNVKSSPPGGH